MANRKGKFIKIRNDETVKRELVSDYNKFQLLLCKWFKILPLDSYRYYFRIEYYGNKIKEDDVLMNSQNILFVVLKVTNNMALLISHGAFSEKPKIYDKLHIVEKKENIS